MPYKSISASLEKTGLCVWPNFLSETELTKTREDIDQIQNTGGFARAATGNAQNTAIQSARQDKTHWLDRSSANPTQNIIWEKLDSLQQSLNQNNFLGVNSFEGHYSIYPEGGFYHRHLDCFKNDDARIVSFVLYLNQNWKSEDGGQLRVYSQDSYRDINPNGGTMVSFLSRESEHEVLENHKLRFSFTGWFKRGCADPN